MVRSGGSRTSGGPPAVTLPVYRTRCTVARTAVLPVPPIRVLPPWFIRPRTGSLEAWIFLLLRGVAMIEARNLTKRYGDKLAVDDLSFSVAPGTVTGFLGPNGAGKSTTMRLLLGLDRPNRGRAVINGKTYQELPAPLRAVGALLEAQAVHNGRSAYNHLLCLAQTQGIPERAVVSVIRMAGLEGVAKKRAGGFSLGMGQRLGIPPALLGNPNGLPLEAPVNAPDPEGGLWITNLMKQ